MKKASLTAPASCARRQRIRLTPLSVALMLALGYSAPLFAAGAVSFNTDILDLNDRQNIDLSQFAQAGYIMPGEYMMELRVNQTQIPEMLVRYYAPENAPNESLPCLTPEMVDKLALKPEVLKNASWLQDGQCLAVDSISGMQVRGNLGESRLSITIPQAWLEYSAANWEPPSRWDNGVPGLLMDYNLFASTTRAQHGANSQSVSGNGTGGVNAGAWRLRADWQMQQNRGAGSHRQEFTWTRFYAYRPLPDLQAKATLGENYLDSGMFDSFRYLGAAITSDDNMLPPNLRGYAPEVTGIAKTNAKVTISQQGRVIYESQVAAGPFRIQDLNDAVSGQLDVRVEEQDGSVQTFSVDTATIPYLTRPGRVRYKFASGKPGREEHKTQGPTFATGEFSWGISNGWSMYGGGLAAGNYKALSMGLGRDLLLLGAISFDATQSQAGLPQQGNKSGGSYRLSYSKRFEELDGQVTFAGYRFSQRNFMSLPQYLDARYRNQQVSNSKELYTITLNKHFRNLNLSSYLSYSHQTYWDRAPLDRWSFSTSRYFDVGRFKNLSLSLSLNRTQYNGKNDDSVYLNFSMPIGGDSSLSYSQQTSGKQTTHSASFYDRLDSNNSYSLSAGLNSDRRQSFSGFYSHQGSLTSMTASASAQQGQYRSASLSLQGGLTLTPQGAALHRLGMPGSTRLMVDTDGVSGVPVNGGGSNTYTNFFGKAVISDVNSYYRNTASIDVTGLADNVEASRPVTQITLTEGAIGYRRFGVIKGIKAMAAIRLKDGSWPPFGASVQSNGREVGILDDDGLVWLSGIEPGASMDVRWNGETQCQLALPDPLPQQLLDEGQNLLLLCTRRAAPASST